jgi:hypothetical protein
VPLQALDRLGLALQGEQGFKETLNRHRAVANIFGKVPSLPREGFVAPSASVVGDVTLGERCARAASPAAPTRRAAPCS